MPSPFPGMDPYLEDEQRWPTFQPVVVQALYQMLLPGLMDRYRARVGWSDGPWSATLFMDSQSHFYHGQSAPPQVLPHTTFSDGDATLQRADAF